MHPLQQAVHLVVVHVESKTFDSTYDGYKLISITDMTTQALMVLRFKWYLRLEDHI